MEREDRLEQLLLHWQESRQLGREVPAEELCADCPDLAPVLRHKIEVISYWEAFLGMKPGPGGSDSPPPVADSPTLDGNRQDPTEPATGNDVAPARKKNWTPPQRAMMRKAARIHLAHGLVLATGLILLGLLGWEGLGRLQAHTLCDRLLEARTADVPGVIQEMAPYRRWLDPLLHEARDQAEKEHDPHKQLHAGLAPCGAWGTG